ncbi:unnamed protein product [Mycena citricolor]|uniref:Uncharacterized protein n=1 Tax=Mycena citricolor TaxID=2018698 RepID=A0AAD2K2U2_9AGAR|nr:unnamed protein product [Mycena citricolor]
MPGSYNTPTTSTTDSLSSNAALSPSSKSLTTANAARPRLARQETELLASYYQSDLADQGLKYSPPSKARSKRHSRSSSDASTSSSEYSSVATSSDGEREEEPASPPPRRSGVPSEGGSDRRRLAIVPMDTVRERGAGASPSTSSSKSRSRGRLEGLALVAPPDAAPGSYSNLSSPPYSAPPHAAADHMSSSLASPTKSHARSTSEVTNTSAKLRDVGIVGTEADPGVVVNEPPKKLRLAVTPSRSGSSLSLLPATAGPVFQEPHPSRGPSPHAIVTPNSSTPELRLNILKRRSTDLSVHTPEIGQSKDIHVPVASPVVVDLGLDSSLHAVFDAPGRSPAVSEVVEPRVPGSPTGSLPLSAYLHYQPGVHSTAGPLPPPPRALFTIDPATPPPPRPPRLHSPPPRRLDGASPSLMFSSFSSSGSSSTSRSVSPARITPSEDEPLHLREGAFSPSFISPVTSPICSSPSDYSPAQVPQVPSIAAVAKPPEKEENLPDEWTHISRDMTSSSEEEEEEEPSVDQKRFSSLPRTPSPSHASLVSSPPLPALPRRRAVRKTVSQYPAALMSLEIATKKTSSERCALYAQKINELYLHDCGLSVWISFAQEGKKKRAYGGLSSVTEGEFGETPRQVSNTSSVRTQATFPRRGDATLATDLSTKPSDVAPLVTALPYPALSLSPRSVTSTLPASLSARMLSAASSSGRSSNLGFFSSLGRKTSISSASSHGHNNSLSKSRGNFTLGQPATARLIKAPPRPTHTPQNPSMPGGPRAVPNRAIRAQSTMGLSMAPISPLSQAMLRRPSMMTPPLAVPPGSAEFERQIDKLSHLLPHAERAVLSGYLRRTGQDMMAIGQYLEDEKNGVLRRD